MPTVTSEVDICNSALIKLGAEPILSLDDSNKRAEKCKLQYPKLRDEVIASHPWNFAITRATLAQSTYVPAFEFEQAYIIPNDVLRIVKTNLNMPGSVGENRWAVEIDPVTNQKVFLTNNLTGEDQIAIQYIKRITDVTKYSPNFVEVLATRLAADLAYPIVQQLALSTQMFALYQQLLRDARTFDAQENSVNQVQADDWRFARN